MAFSLYSISIETFIRMQTNLMAILEKAEAYATERKFKIDNLVGSRLAPDMHPFSFQIQNATDRAKLFAARVSGQTPPSWPDDEKTFAELKARLQKSIDYLKSIDRSQVDGAEDKMITMKVHGQDHTWSALDYLNKNANPNFYFHVTTAYDILRHNGVPIGKRDFTG
jgi:hypothetical protein